MICSQAIFDYRIIGGVIVIIDLHSSENCSRSVTTDIGKVIEIIAVNLHGLEGRRVIYRDTDGIYDEVLTNNDRFTKFKLLSTRSLAKALTA